MNIDYDNTNSKFVHLPFMKRRETADPNRKEKRLPFIGFLPNKVRNHFIAMVGEFCGTFLFLFFAFAGTQVANSAAAAVTNSNAASPGATGLAQAPNAPVLLYISLVFGFSLAVNVWVFFRISGGMHWSCATCHMDTDFSRRLIQSRSHSWSRHDRRHHMDKGRTSVHCRDVGWNGRSWSGRSALPWSNGSQHNSVQEHFDYTRTM